MSSNNSAIVNVDSEEERNAPTVPVKGGSPKSSNAGSAIGNMRLIVALPALGLFISALVLAIATLIEVVVTMVGYIQGEMSAFELATAYIKQADMFLLAVVLEILSLGLVSLFLTDNLNLPRWLTFGDIDDLKERLVSVICVMLGVYFLGYVFEGATGLDVVWMGLGCAVVIIALAFFVKFVFLNHDDDND